MRSPSPSWTLNEIFDHSIKTYAKRTAVTTIDGESLTYAEFGSKVASLRGALRANRVRPGDRVALLGDNSTHWTLAYAAIVTMGAVVVPVPAELPIEEMREIVTHAGCDVMFVSAAQAGRMKQIDNCILHLLILLDNFQTMPVQNGFPAPEKSVPFCSSEIEPVPASVVGEHDLAAILYTSGTTGTPKGVMLTHGNIAHNAMMGKEMQPVREDDVFLSILPLSHSYECTLGFILPFSCGASIYYLTPRPTAKKLQEALGRVRPTMMLTVPLVMENIYQKQVVPRLSENRIMDLMTGTDVGRKLLHKHIGKKLKQAFGGRLRFYGIGGSLLSANVEEFLQNAEFPYAIGYGLTETAPLLTGASTSETRFRSAGKPLRGMEVRVVHVNPATGEGEIQARGPCVMKGYYNEPELTRKTFTVDGWLRTGDLGIVDAKGYIFVKGRLNDVIVRPNGSAVHPEEIEEVINAHPYVEESIVLAHGKSIVAKVKFDREKLGATIDNVVNNPDLIIRLRIEEMLPELRKWVNARVPQDAQIADIVEQRAPFEKTPSQTIRRFMHSAA